VKDFGVNPDEKVSQPLTSLTLLEKVRRKEQDAWDRLVRLYSPLVFHWCKRAGLQPADAEEVGQEVFLAVARAIGSFRRDRAGDSFRGWLRTIMDNKIRDHAPPLGGKGGGGSDVQQRLSQLPAPEPPAASNDGAETSILYRRAVELIESGFEANTRRAFWLVIAGWNPQDIAAELGMSAAAVYIAKSRVLGRLRTEFHDLLDLKAPRAEASSETVAR
jgi:RNA polymerase sigma-70 factor, ECF subfamily